jgi:hypothetical protein|tara:strand:+ start:460 stop:606 length:147 start_codon:yes stop_codon:yes gene_type:complete
MGDSIFLIQRKCKCGQYVLCNGEEKDGDLIDHESCTLNPKNNGKEKKE